MQARTTNRVVGGAMVEAIGRQAETLRSRDVTDKLPADDYRALSASVDTQAAIAYRSGVVSSDTLAELRKLATISADAGDAKRISAAYGERGIGHDIARTVRILETGRATKPRAKRAAKVTA
jgi:hypothetical protein